MLPIKSNSCGSTCASRSSSAHHTFTLARNVHTRLWVTNTHDPPGCVKLNAVGPRPELRLPWQPRVHSHEVSVQLDARLRHVLDHVARRGRGSGRASLPERVESVGAHLGPVDARVRSVTTTRLQLCAGAVQHLYAVCQLLHHVGLGRPAERDGPDQRASHPKLHRSVELCQPKQQNVGLYDVHF